MPKSLELLEADHLITVADKLFTSEGMSSKIQVKLSLPVSLANHIDRDTYADNNKPSPLANKYRAMGHDNPDYVLFIVLVVLRFNGGQIHEDRGILAYHNEISLTQDDKIAPHDVQAAH